MRDITERQEALQAGVVTLVGTDRHRIVETVNAFMQTSAARCTLPVAQPLYGDGHAAERIVELLRAVT